MADYYPLLNRAIAGLADRPDSDRHAIYGRARDALERQLRGFEPALEEDAIRLELDALEATITRIENERAAPPEAPAEPVAEPVAEPAPPITGPSPYKAARPTVDDLPPKAEMIDDPSYTPPAEPQPSAADAAVQPDPPPEAESATPADWPAPAPLDPPVAPLADDAEAAQTIQPMLRPRMPSRREGDSGGRKKPLALFAGVAIAAMMVMGLVAVTHRNRPDVPVGPPVIAAPDSTLDASKTEGRLAGSDTPARPPETKDPARTQTPPETGSAAPPAPETRPPAQPPAAIANTNRAFMVMEVAGGAPNQFEGKTTWTYAPDPALKGQKSLRAAIEFPAGGLAIDFSIARNTDAGINASHTVMVIFDAKNLDNVREMSAVEWRERESQMGTVLAGIVVPVQDNVFMIGLDRTEAALKRNMDVLRSQKWMVFEFRLANGRRGAILVEKGATGEKAVADALADWN